RPQRARSGRLGDRRNARPADQVRAHRRHRRSGTLPDPRPPQGDLRGLVRGYGLVDSPHLQAAPGKTLNLTAVIAPNPRTAAQYFPAGYWFSLIHVPDKREFAATASGSDPGGMAPNVKSQAEWLRILKSGGCWSCHQLGSKGTREIPEAFRSLPTATA